MYTTSNQYVISIYIYIYIYYVCVCVFMYVYSEEQYKSMQIHIIGDMVNHYIGMLTHQ